MAFNKDWKKTPNSIKGVAFILGVIIVIGLVGFTVSASGGEASTTGQAIQVKSAEGKQCANSVQAAQQGKKNILLANDDTSAKNSLLLL